jgi:hypothetical protein
MDQRMNAQDALHKTVHNYPGGCEALAARMGVAAGVLRNKVNPNAGYHKPTLDDVERVIALTGDVAVLHALASNAGHVCIPVDAAASSSDIEVLELAVKFWAASGDVGKEVHATLADGIVEQHEVAAVKTAVYKTVQALNEMVARLEGMVVTK